jgi:aspartate racemase
VLVPRPEDRKLVNRVIYDELVAGEIREASRAAFIAVVDRLAARGAEGVILGCTEIPLLLSEADVDLPLFDTTAIHADAALSEALV